MFFFFPSFFVSLFFFFLPFSFRFFFYFFGGGRARGVGGLCAEVWLGALKWRDRHNEAMLTSFTPEFNGVE